MTPLRRHCASRSISAGKAAAVLCTVALLAVFACVAVWLLVRLFISEPEEREERYAQLIEQAGRRNGVDPDLIRAVVWRESNFNHNTVGLKGEIGLMQIMPGFAAVEWAGFFHRPVPSKAMLCDPALNLEIGSWYLARALRRWSKYREGIALALCEYNAGFSRANAWKPERFDGSVLDRIKIDSTRKYTSDILRKHGEYRQKTARLLEERAERDKKSSSRKCGTR